MCHTLACYSSLTSDRASFCHALTCYSPLARCVVPNLMQHLLATSCSHFGFARACAIPHVLQGRRRHEAACFSEGAGQWHASVLQQGFLCEGF